MNRRQYIRVFFVGIVSAIYAACKKDVGKIIVSKKLKITSVLPTKVYSEDELKLNWVAENISRVSVHTKYAANDWVLIKADIDAKLGEYVITFPAQFSNQGPLSIKITGDELEDVKFGIQTLNGLIIDTAIHTELAVVGGIKNFTIGTSLAFVKRESSASIKCFSAACTHAGCDISFMQSVNKFNCSCHGSQFDSDGNVLQGPASAPLNTYVCETISSEKFRVVY